MRILILSLLACMAALLHAAENDAAPVAALKFSADNFSLVGNTRNLHLSAEPEKPGLLLRWEKDHPPWAEGVFRSRVPLPEAEHMEFRLAVEVPEAAFAATFALRLQDASGETFQLPGVPSEAGKTGARLLNFRFDAGTKHESWGGDGKIDWPLQLQGVSMAFAPGTRDGSIRLGSVRYPFPGGKLDQVKMELLTGSPLSLLSKDAAPQLKLTNTGEEAISFRAGVSAEDFAGILLFRESRELTLAPGESRSVPVADPAETLGVRILDCELTAPGVARPAARRFFYGRMIPAERSTADNREFLFGIHDHTAIDRYELRAEAARLCGARVIRGAGLSWGMLQPSPTVWNFKESDEIINLFTGKGMEVQMILGFTPVSWAIAKNSKKFYPEETRPDYRLPDLAAYENYARMMAERYRDKIRLFEIWNEPDIMFADFSTPEYLKLQEAGRRGVKSAQPDAIVMNGGIALMTPSAGKETIQDEIMASVGKSCDWFAVHGHGPFSEYRDTVARVLELREKHGRKGEWYSNETAMSAAGGQEKEQAQTLYKKLLYAWMNGAAGYTWYDLVNDGFDPYNHEHNFGLLTRDFMPKPAYFVYNMLARNFGGAVRAGRFGDSPLFRTDSGLLLPLWRENDGPSPVLLIETDARSVESIDLMDNARQLELREGKLFLSAGPEPCAIRFTGATRVVNLGTVFSYTGSVIPGKRAVVALELHNPFDKSEDFHLKIGNEEFHTRLAPQSSMNTEMATAVSGSAVPILSWNIGSSRGDITPELAVAFPIPAKERPHIRLDRSRQRVELFPNDPNKLHMTWRGPEDLSATANLSLAGEMLTIEVEVTDDIHSQTYAGKEIYMGDSIQIGLAPQTGEEALLLGIALEASGQTKTHFWHLPEGIDTAAISARVVRQENRTVYRVEIPLALARLDSGAAKRGFRFNLLVNDNDGKGRKGYLEFAPGIGMGLDLRTFPLLLME